MPREAWKSLRKSRADSTAIVGTDHSGSNRTGRSDTKNAGGGEAVAHELARGGLANRSDLPVHDRWREALRAAIGEVSGTANPCSAAEVRRCKCNPRIAERAASTGYEPDARLAAFTTPKRVSKA